MEIMGFEMVLSIIGLLPNAFIAGVCLYFVNRRRTPDAVMLAIGGTLMLLLGLFNFVYWRIIVAQSGYSDPIIPHELMSGLTTVAYFVAEVLIGLGLLFLIQRELRRDPESPFGPPRY